MIPKQIKIGGTTYEVKIAEQRTVKGNNVLMGEVDYCAGSIYINEKLKDDVMEQTLLHEMFHIILRVMGREKLNQDEYFVDALSLNLHQVFRDNGWTFSKE